MKQKRTGDHDFYLNFKIIVIGGTLDEEIDVSNHSRYVVHALVNGSSKIVRCCWSFSIENDESKFCRGSEPSNEGVHAIEN